MYLEDMQTHGHHSCILSRHVKGYKNLQCVDDRNKKVVPMLVAPVGSPLLIREKELQLYLLPQAWLFYRATILLFMQIISQHHLRFASVYILCLYTAFGQEKLKIINNYNN